MSCQANPAAASWCESQITTVFLRVARFGNLPGDAFSFSAGKSSGAVIRVCLCKLICCGKLSHVAIPTGRIMQLGLRLHCRLPADHPPRSARSRGTSVPPSSPLTRLRMARITFPRDDYPNNHRAGRIASDEPGEPFPDRSLVWQVKASSPRLTRCHISGSAPLCPTFLRTRASVRELQRLPSRDRIDRLPADFHGAGDLADPARPLSQTSPDTVADAWTTHAAGEDRLAGDPHPPKHPSVARRNRGGARLLRAKADSTIITLIP